MLFTPLISDIISLRCIQDDKYDQQHDQGKKLATNNSNNNLVTRPKQDLRRVRYKHQAYGKENQAKRLSPKERRFGSA